MLKILRRKWRLLGTKHVHEKNLFDESYFILWMETSFIQGAVMVNLYYAIISGEGRFGWGKGGI